MTHGADAHAQESTLSDGSAGRHERFVRPLSHRPMAAEQGDGSVGAAGDAERRL
jgi:hypothetical protein